MPLVKVQGSNLRGKTNAVRKAIRTGLQVIVALAPNVLLLAAGVLNPAQALALTTFLTPVVTFAQNTLEDRGIVGTWLRRPTPATMKAVERAVQVVPVVPEAAGPPVE